MPPDAAKSRRYAELDALRGIAVFLMIAYHALFDFSYFFAFHIPFGLEAWSFLPPSIASIFLGLVGMSAAISWQRTPPSLRMGKTLRRAAVLIGGACVITAVTWILEPEGPILFGILHLIGVGVFLLLPFYRLGKWNVLAGFAFVLISAAMRDTYATTLLLVPLGITPVAYTALDYYPVFPWFGIILLGSGLAHLLYIPERRGFLRAADISYPRALTWAGRHALFLYFIHQPVLLGLLSAVVLLTSR
ncbi:MAG: heparan-alpha-glucosaminide N-acetyltransferase [Candidatus Peribacteraceae bacterium]|nr:heparan-alpha-glucosaminide N-acetyltransferase [Candidatus Peribacteraceae bacterium]